MQTLIWRVVITLYGNNITAKRSETEAHSKDTKQKKVFVRQLKGSVQPLKLDLSWRSSGLSKSSQSIPPWNRPGEQFKLSAAQEHNTTIQPWKVSHRFWLVFSGFVYCRDETLHIICHIPKPRQLTTTHKRLFPRVQNHQDVNIQTFP